MGIETEDSEWNRLEKLLLGHEESRSFGLDHIHELVEYLELSVIGQKDRL